MRFRIFSPRHDPHCQRIYIADFHGGFCVIFPRNPDEFSKAIAVENINCVPQRHIRLDFLDNLRRRFVHDAPRKDIHWIWAIT